MCFGRRHGHDLVMCVVKCGKLTLADSERCVYRQAETNEFVMHLSAAEDTVRALRGELEYTPTKHAKVDGVVPHTRVS